MEDDFKIMKDYLTADEDGWGLSEQYLNAHSTSIQELIKYGKVEATEENLHFLIKEYEKNANKSNLRLFIFKFLKQHEKEVFVSKFLKENQHKYQERSTTTSQLQLLNPFSRLMGETLSSETIKQLEKSFNLRRGENILSYYTCLGGTLFVTTLNICFEPIVGYDFITIPFMKMKSVTRIRIIIPGFLFLFFTFNLIFFHFERNKI